MASSRTRSRSSAGRSRAGSSSRRSGSSSDSSQTIVMVGAAAVLIVIILVVMMNGDKEPEADTGGTPAAVSSGAGAAQPAAKPVSGSAKAGATPDRPAPALSSETVAELDRLYAEAKTHYNAGVKLRNAGDNRGARAEQAQAKTLLEQWEGLIEAQLLWQEEADMAGWPQPAEYELLTQRYSKFSSLQNRVRKGGGT